MFSVLRPPKIQLTSQYINIDWQDLKPLHIVANISSDNNDRLINAFVLIQNATNTTLIYGYNNSIITNDKIIIEYYPQIGEYPSFM